AIARDPQKELLSEIIGSMNALFNGELTDEDMLNYAKTIKDKVMENSKVVEQVNNNTKEQAMMGGFEIAINDAVIDSLDVHKNLATQVLSEEKIRNGFANIVYDLIAKGLSSNYAVNNTQEYNSSYEEGGFMVASKNEQYSKKDDKIL
ncbi:MAG: hypothetical protein U9R39_02875, partial [Campylobacterota bacterium]|nr:hypothetical protein [Campylobacterota bacterium]